MAARSRTAKASPKTDHYVGAIVEEFRSQQKAVLEAITSLKEEFKRDFATEFGRVNERLSNLEDAAIQNSKDIRKNSEDIKKNSEDILRLYAEFAELRSDVRGLRSRFDLREEKAQIAALEARVTRLEQRLEIG